MQTTVYQEAIDICVTKPSTGDQETSFPGHADIFTKSKGQSRAFSVSVFRLAEFLSEISKV